jgi:hypothetical protein
MSGAKKIIVAKCFDDACGWYGLLSECKPWGADAERPMCPECDNDVMSKEVTERAEES